MSFIDSFKRGFLKEAYFIGFIEEQYLTLPKKERFSKVSWLKLNGYKDGWFADPFFLSKSGNRIQLLVEELVYAKGRGIISLLDIEFCNGKYELIERTSILELPTHLSFPNIIKENDKVYVYPENGRSGGLSIYEFDTNAKRLINPVQIIKGHIVDTSIFKYEGKYFAIGTIHDTDGFEYTKKADVFVSENLLGPYNHYQTIVNKEPVERGAGQIYQQGGRFIRPVQKSVHSYGEAVILNSISFKNETIEETPLLTIEPDENVRYGKCLHTFNTMDGLCVIDGQDYVNYWLGRIVDSFKKILR